MDRNKKFDEIPFFKLGGTPENMPYIPYRLVTIKRGLLAAYEEVDIPITIIDALADLRHLCDRCGIDFASCDKLAYDHYIKEKGA